MDYYNPYIAIAFVTWLLAQLFKFSLNAWRGNLNWRFFYMSGGMPSAHSAVVIALALTALVLEGPRSPIFGLATVFAAIVMYDSFGVRRASGDQAVAINSILKRLPASQDLDAVQLREVFGHRPDEVVAGAAFGAVVSLAMTLNYWRDDVDLLTQAPERAEQWLYLALFSGLVAAALIIRIAFGRTWFKPTPLLRRTRRFGVTYLSSFGLVGLILWLGQFEGVEVLEWRLWSWLLLGIFGVSAIAIWLKWLRFVPERYRAELAKRSQRRK